MLALDGLTARVARSGGEWVLEPGCGSGNFIAFIPDTARVTGVELDPVTAGIASEGTAQETGVM